MDGPLPEKGLHLNRTDNFSFMLSSLNTVQDKQSALDTMRSYCLKSDDPYTQRVGMEFLYVNSYFSELQELINKNKRHSYALNREWANIYQLVINRRRNVSPADMLEQLGSIKTGDPELKCVIEFTKASLHFDMNQFDMVGNFLDMQPRLFDNVNDIFMLSCFNIRLSQYLFMYHWSRNQLIIARKYGFKALNLTESDLIKAHIHINLGLTYTFDTYQQGMYHLNEALKLTEGLNARETMNAIKVYNIPFLSAHFGETEGIETTDKAEMAHLEIARGNLDEAVAILETLPMTSPFHMYYMGLATRNRSLLTAAYNYFIEKQGDLFFARLPLNAINEIFGEVGI